MTNCKELSQMKKAILYFIKDFITKCNITLQNPQYTYIYNSLLQQNMHNFIFARD